MNKKIEAGKPTKLDLGKESHSLHCSMIYQSAENGMWLKHIPMAYAHISCECHYPEIGVRMRNGESLPEFRKRGEEWFRNFHSSNDPQQGTRAKKP